MEAEFTLERLKVVDPLLAAELEGLDPWQIGLVLAELAQRKRARAIAAEIGLDEEDVYHQLAQFERSAVERLRMGLRHGRRRRTIPHRD